MKPKKIDEAAVMSARVAVANYLSEIDLDERTGLETAPCGIDVNALTPGGYEFNRQRTGLIETASMGEGLRPPGQTIETCLKLRADYRTGKFTFRALRDKYGINTKQVQIILRGEWYTPQIKKRERLAETGEPLMLISRQK